MEEIRRAAQKWFGRTGLILLFAEKRPGRGADECKQTGILTSASNLTPAFPSFRLVALGVCSRYSGATVPDSHRVPRHLTALMAETVPPVSKSALFLRRIKNIPSKNGGEPTKFRFALLFPRVRWQNVCSIMDELVIEAGKTERHYWADLWRYRELFFFLSWRDILVRYKQTVIGVLWALIKPVLTIAIFTVLFGKIAGMSSDGLPYPIFVCAGTLPWQFFATAMSESSNSLVSNANMLSKIYFPRLIVPASAVIVSFVDLLISLVILAGLMAWYHLMPTWRLLTLPLFTALGLGAALGVGFWLSALNVKYRDFRYVIPFIVQFGFFLSPVGYSRDEILRKLGGSFFGQTLYKVYPFNPMVGVIDGFRWAIGSQKPLDWNSIILSILVTAVFLFLGLRYFRATEKAFADII
jgi:lipopolysaccharide transport system permease protein